MLIKNAGRGKKNEESINTDNSTTVRMMQSKAKLRAPREVSCFENLICKRMFSKKNSVVEFKIIYVEDDVLLHTSVYESVI